MCLFLYLFFVKTFQFLILTDRVPVTVTAFARNFDPWFYVPCLQNKKSVWEMK